MYDGVAVDQLIAGSHAGEGGDHGGEADTQRVQRARDRLQNSIQNLLRNIVERIYPLPVERESPQRLQLGLGVAQLSVAEGEEVKHSLAAGVVRPVLGQVLHAVHICVGNQQTKRTYHWIF